MSTTAVLLSDRYEKRDGSVVISGVQALVRLMLIQADRDRAGGLSTGGFVSGYRGSPLGTLDAAFAGAWRLTAERGIIVRPAVNEEMAATAVAGTQQIAQSPAARVDGVFSLWYGKGPGLDRAADAIRHGNVQGSSPHGGVVLAVGDDHLAKSSSITCYSDETVAALQIPLFYPADPTEVIEYGLHAFAMSRHTGSWTALKLITEVADSTRTIATGEMGIDLVRPPIEAPAIGLHNRWPETPLEQETRQQNHRLPAVAAYIRSNPLDRTVGKTEHSRIGLVAAGKSWLDLLEGLRLLGLDEGGMASLGLALYKPAVIWPLEPDGLRAFSRGLKTIIVVEEKSPLLERQIKVLLYGGETPPAVWGKSGPDGASLFPATGDVTPEHIAARLGELLRRMTGDAALEGCAARAKALLEEQTRFAVPPTLRKPFFCSGCPHNRSTVLPEGSRATAGIGCHGLAAYNRPATASFAQMGGEGIHWMGLAPFTSEPHLFANMGDGTYFHSGILAVRQAVAAHLNITFKILYNSAVAMTGGQAVDGELSVLRVIEQLRAEGVGTIVVSTDNPARYPAADPVRAKADRIGHRDELQALQRELRAKPGVSVIVYDQMCATEKRRLRKRGKLAEPATRVFINERVCEGCGDCSVTSNCLSVEPVHTPFGIKRRINQSSCNKDYSCLQGFCPSFVTVEGGTPRRNKASAEYDPSGLPVPATPQASSHQRILIAGIGGTGVVTIGALCTMAAHIGGYRAGILDQVGMAQKGGAVVSHLHLGVEEITALRVPAGQADLVLACDLVVGNMRDVMAAVQPGRTFVLANADASITGDFTQNREAVVDGRLLARRLAQRAGAEHFVAHPFTRLSEQLFGDAIGSNLMMLGFAWQKDWIRLDRAALDDAIELNGVAVAMNRAFFAWGRRLAVEPEAVYAAAGLIDPPPETLDQLISRLAAFLSDYQDQAYADRFRRRIARMREAEAQAEGDGLLTRTAAHALFKLMAYKDEYEVARLYADGQFAQALAEQFEGEVKLAFHLAPPLLSRRDKTTGQLRKRKFGPWIMRLFRLLARMKRLRGSPFDPFGYTAERRAERALISRYEELLEGLMDGLRRDRLTAAQAIAALPMEIRGYGHVKEEAIETYRARLREMLAACETGAMSRADESPRNCSMEFSASKNDERVIVHR